MKLIFTDLDGSLLDHHSYSFSPAAALLKELERQHIPVIPVTSKTCAEVLSLRDTLANTHPFIVENGAAIYLRKEYFPLAPQDCTKIGNYWCIRNSHPRSHWQALLAKEGGPFADEYQTFDSICANQGLEGLAALTGLSIHQAMLAQQREFSEPIQWLGTQERKNQFIAQLTEAGATLLQGGRFLTLGGNTDKGRALLQLKALYHQQLGVCQSLAIGDSGNDVSMLEIADSALIIKSQNHPAPRLQRTDNLYMSTATGPQGWAEGVTAWLTNNP